jgi:hypothetical protein
MHVHAQVGYVYVVSKPTQSGNICQIKLYPYDYYGKCTPLQIWYSRLFMSSLYVTTSGHKNNACVHSMDEIAHTQKEDMNMHVQSRAENSDIPRNAFRSLC